MADVKKQSDGEILIGDLLLSDREKLVDLLHSLNINLFEYYPEKDVLILYGDDLHRYERTEGYLYGRTANPHIRKNDLPKLQDFLSGALGGSLELEMRLKGKERCCKLSILSKKNDDKKTLIWGTIRDITREREHESALRDKAQKDSLTMLYNKANGQKLVDDYLRSKNPYVSCALLVIDIDYFKNINDVYGHLFGDTVLIEFARLLTGVFSHQDIMIRAGGDEFAVFLKEIPHAALIRKITLLMNEVRKLAFSENDCAITCSVGVCFLPENVSGYTYQQLFANADWALYRAKEFGRNRYEFCDNLQRYELSQDAEDRQQEMEIDERYLRNDVVSTAFEIFEKTGNFETAISTLLMVIGIRFQLDRITVIHTDTKRRKTERLHQWCAPGIPQVLDQTADFTKEDFLTLFRSYDTNGTTVLNEDDMAMYSESARALLMQGDAKTVVYAAMYCEGKYTGAISYVACRGKRHWADSQRSQFGELTKLISAHLARNLAVNASQQGLMFVPDYDSLTGLISFARFREEAERIIVGEDGNPRVMIYSDIDNFKFFNKKYGYQQGDQLLKEYANYVLNELPESSDIYFSRIASDQFVLFMPVESGMDYVQWLHRINEDFIASFTEFYPKTGVRVRSGIYFVEADCGSVSAALDAANSARKQLTREQRLTACIYDKQFDAARIKENEMVSGMAEALKNGEFEVYFQPKFLLKDCSIVGAEALVRWHKPDGTILPPDVFIPLYERYGMVTELDFFVFEEVAAFLARNRKMGIRQVPVSINASVLHAAEPKTVQRYVDILKKYEVDPSLTEIELTETATVSDYGSVISLFNQLHNVNILTSLDDFGAGYSVLNSVINIPVNTIKIDRAFLLSCETNPKGVYFLKQIIRMVKGLGYRVLCEGIETKQQMKILREAGCDEGQGFWFSRPLPMAEFEKLLREQQDGQDRPKTE